MLESNFSKLPRCLEGAKIFAQIVRIIPDFSSAALEAAGQMLGHANLKLLRALL